MWDIASSVRPGCARTVAAAFVILVVALVVQVSVIARLDLPGGRVDLVLVLLGIMALIEGPVFGAVLGFTIGLVADLSSSHVIGESALVLCLIGYAVGLAMDAADRSVMVPLATIGVASALGTLGYAALTSILGEAAMTGTQAVVRAVMAGIYSLLLTPFLFPLLTAGARRLTGERRRSRW